MMTDHRLLNVRTKDETRTVVLAILLALFAHDSAALAQCGFESLGQLPGLGVGSGSAAMAVSADGQVAVGLAIHNPLAPLVGSATHPFRWTQATGMVDPFPPAYGTVTGVSADGSVVVGNFGLGSFGGGFRWASGGGVFPIANSDIRGVSGGGFVLVGSVHYGSPARWLPPWIAPQLLVPVNDPTVGKGLAASWDGAVVVGWRYIPGGPREPFRWTENEGMVGLGTLGGAANDGAATSVSSDGSVVVGYAASASADLNFEAFRWTEATGMVGLGFLPGAFLRYSKALGVSGDGSIVVGESQGRAEEGITLFVWTPDHGMRRLSDVLTIDCNLDLAGQYLRGGTYPASSEALGVGISADGTTIVGTALGPDYTLQAFLARIPRGFADCNHNGIDDAAEITAGTSEDCNGNSLPDECDVTGCTDDPACADCNTNAVPDGCDIAADASTDANGNGVPDECDDCCAGCDDGNACTADACVNGVCQHTPILPGDIDPCGGDGDIDADDILAVLNAFAGTGKCNCPP